MKCISQKSTRRKVVPAKVGSYKMGTVPKAGDANANDSAPRRRALNNEGVQQVCDADCGLRTAPLPLSHMMYTGPSVSVFATQTTDATEIETREL